MRRLSVLGLVAALALAAGCGGDDEPAATPTTPGDTAAAPTPAGDSAETPTTPAAGGDAGGRITFASYLPIDVWDPAVTSGGPNIPIHALIYDSLVEVDPTGRPTPGLAESWEYSDDGLTLTLTLRDDVVFSDGMPFDAEAAKANIDRSRTLETSTIKAVLAVIAETTAVDATTLELTLSTPDTTLPLVFADRPGFMASPAVLEQDPITEPIGSGPFVLTDETPGQTATFDRNPDYWNAETILLDGVDMVVMNDSTTRINALQSGAIDMTMLDSSQVADAEGRGMNLTVGPDPRFYSLQLNPDVEPALADPNVRLALSLAIDRQGMVSGIFFDNAVPIDQVFLPGTGAFNDDIVGAFDRDVERAQQLLADAGYADGFGFTMVLGLDPVAGSIAEAIQAQLAEIGVTVEIQKLEGFGPGQAYWTDKTVAGAMFRVTTQLASPTMVQRLYAENGVQNPGQVTSPTVDELLATALAEPDPAKVDELMQQISAELVEQPLSVIPILQENVVIATADGVEGVQTWLTGYPNFTGVSTS